MVLPLCQFHSLIMVMDIIHNLTPMDTTLEVTERERLNQVMELVTVLLPHLSTHMEDQALTTEPLKDFPAMGITDTERDQLSQVMESVLVSQPFNKAAHTTMDLMDIISTMFMERDLLNHDTFMESTTASSLFQDPTLAMVLMLPTLIKDC